MRSADNTAARLSVCSLQLNPDYFQALVVSKSIGLLYVLHRRMIISICNSPQKTT